MNLLKALGNPALLRWRSACGVAAVGLAVLRLAARPARWKRTVRRELARQIIFSGVDALGLTLLIAVLAGISVVAQLQLWLIRFGQSEMLGSVLVALLVREVGPVLVCVLVTGRSGTAIATELANMSVLGEVKVLDAQGVDPVAYLVVPRVLGMVASIFSLTVIFVMASLGAGYVFGSLSGIASGAPGLFANSVFRAITPGDLLAFAVKTVIPGLVIGSICCTEGLDAGQSVTDVPRAATRAVVRSIAGVVLISAAVSVMAYML